MSEYTKENARFSRLFIELVKNPQFVLSDEDRRFMEEYASDFDAEKTPLTMTTCNFCGSRFHDELECPAKHEFHVPSTDQDELVQAAGAILMNDHHFLPSSWYKNKYKIPKTQKERVLAAHKLLGLCIHKE